MKTAPTENLDRIRELAASLDCLLEDDVTLLIGITPGTAQAWRKRGIGPAYAVIGNRTVYPRAAIAAYLASKLRERTHVVAEL